MVRDAAVSPLVDDQVVHLIDDDDRRLELGVEGTVKDLAEEVLVDLRLEAVDDLGTPLPEPVRPKMPWYSLTTPLLLPYPRP